MEHPDHNEPHVQVSRTRRHRPQADCSCGWTEQPRWFTAAAVLDALDHYARTGHAPTQPLDTRKAFAA